MKAGLTKKKNPLGRVNRQFSIEFCSTSVGPGSNSQRWAPSQKECSFSSLWDNTFYWNLAKSWLASSPRINFNGLPERFHTTLLGQKCVKVPSREVETDAFLPSDGLLARRKKLGGSTFLLSLKDPGQTLEDSRSRIDAITSQIRQ